MNKIPDIITMGDKYRPAMEITTKNEATEYFERCVEHTMRIGGKTREEAESLEKKNIGYFAGYYDHETRMRVEQLYNCVHPIFGAAKDHIPTPKEAFEAGFKIGSTHLGKIQKEKR